MGCKSCTNAQLQPKIWQLYSFFQFSLICYTSAQLGRGFGALKGTGLGAVGTAGAGVGTEATTGAGAFLGGAGEGEGGGAGEGVGAGRDASGLVSVPWKVMDQEVKVTW